MTSEEHKELFQSGIKNIRGRFIIQEIQDPIQKEAKLKSLQLLQSLQSLQPATDSSRRLNKSKTQSKFRTNSKPNVLNVTNKNIDLFIYDMEHYSYIDASIILSNIKTNTKINRPIFKPKISSILLDIDDTSPSLSECEYEGKGNSLSLVKYEQLTNLEKKLRKDSYDFISNNLQTIIMNQSIQLNNDKSHHAFKFPTKTISSHPHEEIKYIYKNQQKLNDLLNVSSGYECDLLEVIQVNSFTILSYSIYRCFLNL